MGFLLGLRCIGFGVWGLGVRGWDLGFGVWQKPGDEGDTFEKEDWWDWVVRVREVTRGVTLYPLPHNLPKILPY